MSKDLSIEGAQDQLPPGLVPSEFPLVHEYYTPTVVAEAVAVLVCPLLPELGGYGIGGVPPAAPTCGHCTLCDQRQQRTPSAAWSKRPMVRLATSEDFDRRDSAH
jgi:hypothetical protein